MVGNPATAHDNYATDMREIKEMPTSGGDLDGNAHVDRRIFFQGYRRVFAYFPLTPKMVHFLLWISLQNSN
jgi:hypothetical protein